MGVMHSVCIFVFIVGLVYTCISKITMLLVRSDVSAGNSLSVPQLTAVRVVKRHFTTSYTHPNPYPSLSQYIVANVPNLVRKSFPCAK